MNNSITVAVIGAGAAGWDEYEVYEKLDNE